MENINFYKINDAIINDAIFYEIGDIAYTMSLNIEEDIQRIKTLTQPPYSMTFSGVEEEVVVKVISQLFDDLSEITSLKKYKNENKTFDYIISIEPKREEVAAFVLYPKDIRIVQIHSSNPYQLEYNNLFETTQYDILNNELDCYYLVDELTDEEYALFDEDEELMILEPDNIYHLGLKQKVKEK